MTNEFKYVNINDLQKADWASVCYIVKPDKIQLHESIKTYGILSPVVINSDNTVIDGYNRLDIASSIGIKDIPVIVVNISKKEEILLHIDLNRYRGVVVAKFLSNLIQRLVYVHNVREERLREKMRLSSEEFYTLLDGSLIKMRKIKQHSYSPAWVPIESSTGDDIQIERPTGHTEQV